MTAMKEMFRDVVQTVMEVELDEELGRERCQRAEASETKLAEPGQNKLTGAPLSPKTIREHHRVISSVLSLAVKEGLIPNNAGAIYMMESV